MSDARESHAAVVRIQPQPSRARLSARARSAALFGLCMAVVTPAPAGPWRVDPATILPLERVAATRRAAVAEVIRENTFHRRGETDTFPCNPRLYLGLLNEPALTLALWRDISDNPVRLQRLGPNLYTGTDGTGAAATWEFVLRSPNLHVLYCDLDYKSPSGRTHLDARLVLLVHTDYYKDGAGAPWIRHAVEVFVKVDSRGWKTVAKTIRPVLENLLEDQVREAGWFVSLMGRLVEKYPDWACQATEHEADLDPVLRARFRKLVNETRKPDASTGRPTLATDTSESATARRR